MRNVSAPIYANANVADNILHVRMKFERSKHKRSISDQADEEQSGYNFTLSSCGTRLSLCKPDILIDSASTPSFHCRGVTLLTSLITALIYSGVNSRRWKPFAELTLEERKKEFPQRLTDALFSITKRRLKTIAEISKKLDEADSNSQSS